MDLMLVYIIYQSLFVRTNLFVCLVLAVAVTLNIHKLIKCQKQICYNLYTYCMT